MTGPTAVGSSATATSGIGPPTVRHTISIVIPVYQGARTLPGLLAEIAPLAEGFTTSAGHHAVVTEVLLVDDNGPDNSAAVIRDLVEAHDLVRPVWLSRNYGQHPATLAGMASSGGDWIVTLDEDGQHDPAAIGGMLDVAMAQQADLVYAQPTNDPPHGAVRNLASRLAKRIIAASAGTKAAKEFHSFRLVLGEVGRSVAAYAGAGAYLDVAMSWVARRITTCPVTLRAEGGRPSGYSFRSLSSHFWRMVLSSGTKGLRLVSLLGVVSAIAGVGLAIYLAVARWGLHAVTPAGWPSLMVVLLLCSGAVLFSLGVIAEYIGVNVNMAMGRPLYLIVSDPAAGPLGRRLPARVEPAVALSQARPVSGGPVPARSGPDQRSDEPERSPAAAGTEPVATGGGRAWQVRP